jgi:hypothetical protein
LPEWVAFRLFVVAGLACAALAVALPSASGRPTVRRDTCVNPDTGTRWEAVFAHTTSISQATLIRRQLAAKGFRGIKFEKDYCDDIELIVSGPDSPAQRKALAREGDSVAAPVSFESPDNQKPNRPGDVTAVFAHLPTLSRASSVQGDIAVMGWRESDIVRVALHDWKVIVAHIPAGVESGFAAEAKRVGYKVTFESG